MKRLLLPLFIILFSFSETHIGAQESSNQYDEILAENIAQEYEKQNKTDIEDHITYLKERNKYETVFGLDETKDFSRSYTPFFKEWIKSCQTLSANNAHGGVVYGCKKIVSLLKSIHTISQEIDTRRHHLIETIDQAVNTIKPLIKDKPFDHNVKFANSIAQDLAAADLDKGWDLSDIYTKNYMRNHENYLKTCSLSHRDPLNNKFGYCVHLADFIEEQYKSSFINTPKKEYAKAFVRHVRSQEQQRIELAQNMLGNHTVAQDNSTIRASLAKKIQSYPGWRIDIERSLLNCELNAPVYKSISIKSCGMLAQQLKEIEPSLTGKEKLYTDFFIENNIDAPYFDKERQNRFETHTFGPEKEWFNMPY